MEQLTINITGEGMYVNSEPLTWPLSVVVLKNILGDAKRERNQFNYIYTWEEAGVYAFAKTAEAVQSLVLYTSRTDSVLMSKHFFNGVLLIEGEPYQRLGWRKKYRSEHEFEIETKNYNIYVEFDDYEGIRGIELAEPLSVGETTMLNEVDN